ncbi:MAG TPA: tRNA pseudouridine(13) synthase TruD [Micromonosporaceae bacterium]|nr:tRNA pseudouridine(13) synthase TruD [Micromonosporaceae bacterium]
MSDAAVLKHCPADFLVRENLVVPLVERPDASYHYLLLRKSGYTTMEAVRVVAGKLGLPTQEVTYGGLKDEDGITEQLVGVPLGAVSPDPDGAGWGLTEDADRWLHLGHYGYGTEPLRIGGLEGNGFRIVLRNLDAGQAGRLAQLRKVNLLFVNYYDTQRFGVPGGPKRTHLVGAAMLAGQWDLARSELAGLRAPESEMAAAWRGPARELFAGLDPRTASFYLAAHASHRWNADVRELVTQVCPGEWFDVEVDGLAYRYLRYAESAVRVLGAARELPYQKYTYEGGQPVSRSSMRPTVVQTMVSIGPDEPDERIPGRFRVRLSFFLPSGCYATAAVRQLTALTTVPRRRGGGMRPDGEGDE